MVLLKLKHVYRSRDRQGRDRYLLRLPGRKAVTIKGAYGSPEFMANYQDAIEPVERIHVPNGAPGTIAALVPLFFGSDKFTSKKPSTQRSRRSVLERFAENHGDKRVDNLRPRHVQAMVDAKGPNAARHFLIAVRLLMAFAISIGWCRENPTKGVTRAQIKTPGYATWAEEDIEAFYAAYPIGTRERLALELLLWTGQRRGDVVRMGRQLIRGGVMQITQEKTGETVFIPVLPPLQAAIDALPDSNMTFLVTEYGRPFTANGFGNWFRARCRAVGVTKSPHGLRKATCRRLAEAGRSASEIAAVTGHRTLKEVERYTRAADRKRMAIAAMTKTYQEQGLAHAADSFAHGAEKQQKTSAKKQR